MALKENKYFRWIVIPLCIALCFIGRIIPPFGGLSQSAMQVLLIFLGVLILWLTVGIDWPSLLCIFALGFVPELGFKTVFTSSFGNSTFIFLLFTFICTYALSKTTIIKRITLFFVNSKIAKSNGLWFSFLFLFSVLLVGLFTSPSVLFFIILPLLNEILAVAKIEKGEKIAKALMMGLGFTVSISSGMTLIAHIFPVNAIIAAEEILETNLNITPLTYSLFAVPVGLVVFILMFVVLFIFYKPNYNKLKNIDTTNLVNEMPKWNKQDTITLVTFLGVILLWVLPELFKGLSTDFDKFITDATIAMPPILGTLVLLIARVEGKPILKIDEAFKNVPWTSLIMCAATLVLGVALTKDEIGIKTLLTTKFGGYLENIDGFILLLIFVLWAALQTNVSSNMVTATVVATVAAGVLGNINSSLSIATIIAIIGLLASFAFATPPSMPHIAYVAGGDHCNVKDVLVYGGITMFISIVVVMAIGYPLGLLVF